MFNFIYCIVNVQEFNPVNSKTYPNEITDERSKLDVTTVSGETSSDNVTNLENEKVHKLDEDQEYGKYVTQRLKNIKNSTVKQNIKLEIDYLFYIQIKKMLQKNELSYVHLIFFFCSSIKNSNCINLI